MIRLIGSTCKRSNAFSGGVLMFRFLIGTLEVTYCLDFNCNLLYFTSNDLMGFYKTLKNMRGVSEKQKKKKEIRFGSPLKVGLRKGLFIGTLLAQLS